MASVADVESEEPEFAARVRASFDARVHTLLALARVAVGVRSRRIGAATTTDGMPGCAVLLAERRAPGRHLAGT